MAQAPTETAAAPILIKERDDGIFIARMNRDYAAALLKGESKPVDSR